MFTGIIEETGCIESFTPHHAGASLFVKCAKVLADLTVGASIAVNGVCLTAVSVHAEGFGADLAPETLLRTNLAELHAGSVVNLERPLNLSTRLSGHIVQGHVDARGAIESLTELGDGNWELTVRVPHDLQRFLVYKGSICIDGISLTIAAVKDNLVRVAIIPHTYHATNLNKRKVGEPVNIECDVLAKHVDKLLHSMRLPLA